MVISSSTSTGFQSPFVDDSLSETRGVSSSNENDRGALHGRAKRLTPSESTSLPSLSEIKRQKGASYPSQITYSSIVQESFLAKLKKSIADWKADEDGSEIDEEGTYLLLSEELGKNVTVWMTDGDGNKIDEKGNKYVGEWKSGKRNGIGKLTCVNGDYFEGRWRNDEFFSGKGRKTDENGDVYEGDWEYGEFDGRGTKININGDEYRGTWRNGVFLLGQVQLTSKEPQYVGGWNRGQPHGEGEESYKNGNWFKGLWKDGELISGKVSLTYQGGQYDGDWRIDKPHGQGKATYENGDCFEGIWEDGLFVSGIEKRSENGDLLEVTWDGGYEVSFKRSKTYADGRIYFGCWENRRFHGQGKLTFKNGCYKEGEWNKGEFVAGEIREKDKDGNTYKGCWISGKYNGQGKLTCNNRDYKDGEWKDGQFVAGKIREKDKDGNTYEGCWISGKYNGQGKLTCNNRDYKDGEWKDGLFVSGIEGRNEGLDHYEIRWSAGKPISCVVQKLYEDGSKYVGGWKDGKCSGQGKKYKNGYYSDGEWRDDQFISGKVRKILEDSVIYEGGWEEGKCSGRGKKEYGNGDYCEGEWRDDEFVSGQVRKTLENGVIYKGGWEEGKCSGRGKKEYKNGDYYDGEWCDDQFISGQVRETFGGGEIYEGGWKDGKRSGQGRKEYENGDYCYGEWCDDQFISGQVRETRGNGVIYEGGWKNGKLVLSLALLFAKAQETEHKAISKRILEFCDAATQRALRATGSVFKQAVKEYCELQTPFKNKTDFVCSVGDVFWASKFSRVSPEGTLTIGYNEYQKIKIQESRAFLEVFTEKFFLFTNNIREVIEPLGRIISPPKGTWTPEVNDCWILGHIHHRNDFQLLADPSFLPNFWAEREVRPTALGREIYQIWQAGYRPEKTPDCWGPDNLLFKFEGKGVLLTRKKDIAASVDIKNAQGATKESLESILSKIRGVIGGCFETVTHATGQRAFCGQGHEVALLREKIGGRWQVVQKCKPCEMEGRQSTFFSIDGIARPSIGFFHGSFS